MKHPDLHRYIAITLFAIIILCQCCNGSMAHAERSGFSVAIDEISLAVYQYSVTDASGHILAEGTTEHVPPRILPHGEDIVEISQYLGPAVWSTVFCHLQTGEQSGEYQNVLFVQNGIVVYLDFNEHAQQWSVVASHVFDQNDLLYCEPIDLAPADGHVEFVQLMEDHTLLVQYICTDEYAIRQLSIPLYSFAQ